MTKFVIFSLISLILVPFGLAKSGVKSISSERPSIRILNWWNYMDERILGRVRDSGFDLDVSIYHSNEVAMSRLLSKRDSFEIAIVSNINLERLIKEDIFDTELLKKLSKKRNYNRLVARNSSCIPYLWGTTLYAYDGRNRHKPPNTLDQLKSMKAEGFKIGVLDDPFEIAARILGDNIEKCLGKNFLSFFSNIDLCKNSFSKYQLGFSSGDFLTSADEFLQHEKIAVYTWQGGVFTSLEKAPWLKFSLPQNHPVIGADYVCILKNAGLKKDRAEKILKVIELLTDRKSTEFNVETNQYFSPYINHTTGLKYHVAEMYAQLLKKIKVSEPIFLTTPSARQHNEINKWWKKVRYEKN